MGKSTRLWQVLTREGAHLCTFEAATKKDAMREGRVIVREYESCPIDPGWKVEEVKL